MLITVAVLVGVVVLGGLGYVRQEKFGGFPEGERLARMERSAHYADGAFHNLIETPMFTGDASFASVVLGNLLDRPERLVPDARIPVVKTDLKALDPVDDVVVWLGHSSYFVQIAGKRLLIDPVFSDDAAPVPYANRAFPGANPYGPDDVPAVDALLVTHDHWDHLDHPSVIALKDRVGTVITGLGVGVHFERWGIPPETIVEADWNTALDLGDGLIVHVLPARHYSGRMLTRNQTLWVGFALETPARRIVFSGDSGYGPHFAEIGRRLGSVDLAVLDSGQYDARWAYIHMTPEEAAQAAEDLGAVALMPAHVGKFSIARHAWDEPFARIVEASRDQRYRLLTPMIGEPVDLGDAQPGFTRWWDGLEGGSTPN